MTVRHLAALCAMAAAVALSGCATHQSLVEDATALREPSELRSHDGVLRATLPAEETAVNIAGSRVRGKFYARSFPGPTLRVKPGDTIELRFVNRMCTTANYVERGTRP